MPGHNERALYVNVLEGTHSVRHTSWVGRTVPYGETAAGKAFRGAVPSAGYVMVTGAVEPEVTAMAAPIRSSEHVIAVLSIIGPTYRLTQYEGRYGALLSNAAHRLSAQVTESQ